MQLTKKTRVHIIGESSGETATSPCIADHKRTLRSHHEQRIATQLIARLALPGDDKQSHFIASCHYQAALLGRLFFIKAIVKFITINAEERL